MDIDITNQTLDSSRANLEGTDAGGASLGFGLGLGLGIGIPVVVLFVVIFFMWGSFSFSKWKVVVVQQHQERRGSTYQTGDEEQEETPSGPETPLKEHTTRPHPLEDEREQTQPKKADSIARPRSMSVSYSVEPVAVTNATEDYNFAIKSKTPAPEDLPVNSGGEILKRRDSWLTQGPRMSPKLPPILGRRNSVS